MESHEWWSVFLTVVLLSVAVITFVTVVTPTNDMVDQLKDRMEYHAIDYTETIYIESLKDGSATTGSFILGSGSVNGYDVYIYYTKNEQGGYVRSHVNADMSIIYMDENEKPYLVKHFSETNRLHKRFESSYSFHVPNGTVTKTFNVV